jgi:hypothetical protein
MNNKLIKTSDILLLKLIVCFVALQSCNLLLNGKTEKILSLENEDAIFAVWQRMKVKHNYLDKAHEEMMKKHAVDPKDYDKDYYISLFPDGRGSISFRTELDSLVWVYNKSDQIIMPTPGKSNFGGETIQLIESENDTLLKLIDKSGVEEMYFEKRSNLTTNYKEDPNYPINNLWRIRAYNNSSDSQIEFKVNNYLKHYELLFKASLDKQSKRSFTNAHSMGILKIYKSAFGIVNKDQISEDWYSYFYTKEEALKAYEILKKKLKGNHKIIKKTKNWVKDNYDILHNLNETKN